MCVKPDDSRPPTTQQGSVLMSDVTGILAVTNQYHLVWDYVELIAGLREAFVLLRAAARSPAPFTAVN